VDRIHRRSRGASRGAAIAAAAVLVLLLGGTGYADPHDDKNRVDGQLAQTQATLEAATDRAKQAAAEHDAATAALPGAEAAAADAKGRAIGAEVGARQAQRDSDTARAAESDAGAAYRAAAAEVDRGRDGVSAFIAAAYKGSAFSMVNTILESGSPSDLATRIGYLDHIAADQQRALRVLTTARMAAKQRGDAALLARRRADAATANARGALAVAVTAQSAAEQAAATVRALVAQTAQSEAVANQERTAVLARYEELKVESDQIAAQLRADAAQEAARARAQGGTDSGNATPPRVGAFFLMPVHGWKSSNFGMRYDPYYHVWQLHAGVDLAAGGGTPIVAAAAGRVVRTGWYGGYGNYTCLSHGRYQGKGLATCYGHQSQILVAVGQTVGRGEMIGKVGTTGASTGYHLHFEVRLDGVPVDPLGWLPGCLC
jgi:murein DD-endopeptidase MepM/ murein hydrolase activator NlpD